MTEEPNGLKACPFCGGRPSWHYFGLDGEEISADEVWENWETENGRPPAPGQELPADYISARMLMCNLCGADVLGRTAAETVAKWNLRAVPDSTVLTGPGCSDERYYLNSPDWTTGRIVTRGELLEAVVSSCVMGGTVSVRLVNPPALPAETVEVREARP